MEKSALETKECGSYDDYGLKPGSGCDHDGDENENEVMRVRTRKRRESPNKKNGGGTRLSQSRGEPTTNGHR